MRESTFTNAICKAESKQISKDFAYCEDAISRQAAIDAINTWDKFGVDERSRIIRWHEGLEPYVHLRDVLTAIVNLPSAQPEKRTEERMETHACDLIDREAAVDAIYHHLPSVSRMEARLMLHEVPSARPERTCVNCGRTANNGGWYADGGTRCPIEEHYALPKDGYCHLWEERNITDDDYPERREDERPES